MKLNHLIYKSIQQKYIKTHFCYLRTVKRVFFQSTIEDRTYIWYNQNILYETMYMSLRLM
ncbi:hypothetical protein CON07_15790 [Bacillus sp. AFS094611]|uniref:Uncharacterized protein n=2 Tax=Bacillus cereus group TaxID=86661 RepID=A0A2A7D389_BACAN|nr:hypothetical protein BK707_08960 [Bacillus thuringiensis serovar coreanensis]OTX41658.1 hypothetical protein BK724_30835 [Bacillus thuringiensis serovar sooncheon]OTX47661.1 hypothetical protein BK725_29770 [Bacillus thuringiensis serovar guiyangiensis]OTX66040.1 hypothetical protein BK727_24795 [Bacillus thuringiensis serovar roskildiensis]PDZ14407.1 hypothetical protein CON16_24100 [Bacillus anthracis]PDZ50524.1 hypothetical protein CON07_15790 [Bacillus sp. AFS094611]